ncbi:MAG: caspase family protein [Candidatus Contendobacter sp.]|nr:caspase family protein [Candidatus Contendobacter sp.]
MKRHNRIAVIGRRMQAMVLLLALWVLAADVAADGLVAPNEPRTALVVGNTAYTSFRPLTGPINDARDMATALKNLGFEVVSADNNINFTKRVFREKVNQFVDRLKIKGGVGLFYFSGHGAQVDGKNFLIPIDLVASGETVSAADVTDGAISADWVLGKMNERHHPFNLIILDACRNEPKTKTIWGGGDGLAPMIAPAGTLIAYATAPGTKSADGNPNSIYTARLLEALRTRPHLEIKALFQSIRNSVIEDSSSYKQELGALQTPWEAVSMTIDFYFTPSDSKDIDIKPSPSSLKNFQNEIINITESIITSFYNRIFTIAGLIALLVMMGFALMYRHFRVTNQAPFNSRILSRMIRERMSRSCYKLSHVLTFRRKEQALQPTVDVPPPIPKIFYRLVPQRNDRGLPTLILSKPGNYRLGRMQADNIQLVVPSQYVSSEHLVITVNPDYSVAVENLKPTNKTHISGEEIPSGQIRLIQPGQTLRLGHDEVIYSLKKG